MFSFRKVLKIALTLGMIFLCFSCNEEKQKSNEHSRAKKKAASLPLLEVLFHSAALGAALGSTAFR